MLRVYRDDDGDWWLDRRGLGVYPTRWSNGPDRARSLDDLEPEIRTRLTTLLFVEPGGHVSNVGRRVDDKTFWLYYEEQDGD